MSVRGGRGALIGVMAGFGSFRVLMALATSLSITAAVAGPMAVQARETRRELAAAAEPAEPPPDALPTDPREPDEPSPSTTSDTTTTTPDDPVDPTVPAPTTTSPSDVPPVIDTPPPPPPGRIAVSLTDDYSESYEMDGFEVFGLVFLRLDVDDADEVRFWIDDGNRSGPPARVDRAAPFELAEGGFDSSELSAGPHVLTVEVDGPNGTSVTSAGFTVVR